MKNKKFLILLLCLVTILSIATTVILLWDNANKPVNNPVEYPPVSTDPAGEPIDNENISQPPLENPEGGGAVSLSYSKEAFAQKGEGTATIMFQNPSKSNQSIVIQLHIPDKELIEKIGKTGRKAADKAKIEGAEGYDSETSRMIVAESGLLAPGYKLSTIRLKALPDGTVLPNGIYNAVYYILAYDTETNERAIVNMQIPITLTIGN